MRLVCHLRKAYYLRRVYESLIERRTKKRACIAVGHKIRMDAYYILKYKLASKDLGYAYLDRRRKVNLVQSYLDKLRNLGVSVQITAIP